MKAAIVALAVRASASPFSRTCARAADLLDRAIPIVLVSLLVVGAASVHFGLLD